MSRSTPVRSSGRKRQRTSYADAFDSLDLGLSSSSEEEAPTKRKNDGDEDDEFSIGEDAGEVTVEEEEEEEEETEDVVVTNRPYRPTNGEGSPGEEHEEFEEDDDIEGNDEETGERKKPNKRVKKDRMRTLKEIPAFEKIPTDVAAKSHRPAYRVSATEIYKNKNDRIAADYGKDDKDIVPLLRYRDKWANEKCLPRKRATVKDDQGGLHESYFQTDEQRLEERTTDWDWYWRYGAKAFSDNQKTRHLKEKDGREFLQIRHPDGKTVLLGHVNDRKPYQLAPLESINFGEAWEDGETNTGASQASGSTRHEGWMINVGDGKVQSLDWSPNSHEELHFVAVSTIEIKKEECAPVKKIHKRSQQSGESKDQREGPIPQNAFTPAPNSPSCIEIWAIAALDSTEKDGCFDLNKAPKLCQVICTNWGPVRHLKWSPAPRTPKNGQQGNKVGLGLLAGLWGDGQVRVIDVNVNMAKNSTEWIHCTQTAFSYRPSSTVHTCIAWLSSTHLGAGCANGFVAVYDLETLLSPATSPFSKEKIQRPFFYHPVHHTYISALTSGYPSRSNFIFTSAMDGYVGVTDIHAPETDRMLSIRSRQGALALAWCEALQAIIVAWEDMTIRILYLRKLYTSSIIGRSGSFANAIATSRLHPCLIASSTDGVVVASNPLRKFWSAKSSMYQQIWFWHEWSGRNEVEGGISRITEGFRVNKGEEKKGVSVKNSILLATLYEEEQAATCLAWCPNLECGGWAAAGTGSGLIRIEDLST